MDFDTASKLKINKIHMIIINHYKRLNMKNNQLDLLLYSLSHLILLFCVLKKTQDQIEFAYVKTKFIKCKNLSS
jgi:hypothetical protein